MELRNTEPMTNIIVMAEMKCSQGRVNYMPTSMCLNESEVTQALSNMKLAGQSGKVLRFS